MNQLEAMRDTVQTMNDRRLVIDNSASQQHIRSMLERMESGEFSEGKMGRWLGWAQGFLCAHGVLTLNECKEINRRNA